MKTLNSKGRHEKLVMVVLIFQNTQNVLISRCCFAEDGQEMYRDSNARAQPFFCSLNLLFRDLLVSVTVVGC